MNFLESTSGVFPLAVCIGAYPSYRRARQLCGNYEDKHAGLSGRAVEGAGPWPLAWWDCGFESRRKHGCLSLASVVFCQVDVSASGWSFVQRSFTECGVSECDREASIMRRPWPIGCHEVGEKKMNGLLIKSPIRSSIKVAKKRSHCPII
jgi:hypothetical protein